MNAAEPAWVAAEQPPVPEPSPPNGDAVGNPAPAVKEEDGEAARSGTCSIFALFYRHVGRCAAEGPDWCYAGNSLPHS